MQTQEDRYREHTDTVDSVLVSRALSGDQEAFEALVSRYRQFLLGQICHSIGDYHEAEDILQQVWLKLNLSCAPSSFLHKRPLMQERRLGIPQR